MIPRSEINAWRVNVPWQSNEQVEQDLIIARFIVDLFPNDKLKDKFAFRGGTAIHKLFINPPARYSDDIDLVQIHPGPIGEILNTIQDIAIIKVVHDILGKPTYCRYRPSQDFPKYHKKSHSNSHKTANNVNSTFY